MTEIDPAARSDRIRRRRVTTRALVVAALVTLATVPLLASALRIGPGWLPQGDNAFIALRGDDVFTEHTPLLGMPSTVSGTVGRSVNHPGPLESQVIGIFATVTDDVRIPLIAASLVNLASVLAVLGWALRLGGLRLLAVAAPVMAALLWSLRGPILVTPFNPYAAVLPYLAMLVSLVAAWARIPWSVTVAVLFGSWAAQAHLTTSGPVLAAAGAGVLVAAGRWARRRRREGAGASQPDPRRVAVGLGCVTACWAVPAYEALANRGGNVRALVDSGSGLGDDTLGAKEALHVLVNALSLRPVWAQAGAGPLDLLGTPSDGAYLGAALLGLAAVVAAVACRRSHPAVTGSAVLAITSLVAGATLMSKIPGAFQNVFSLHNYLWLWPATAVLWVSASSGVCLLLGLRFNERGPSRSVPRSAALVFSGAVVTAALAGASLANTHRASPPTTTYQRSLEPVVAEELDKDGAYLIEVGASFAEFDLGTGLLYALERAGFDVRLSRDFERAVGSHRVSDGEGRGVLEVRATRTTAPPRTDAIVIASYHPPRDLVARRDRAERDLVREIARCGGVTLADGRTIDPEDASGWVESGGFVAAADFRIVDSTLVRSSAGRTLMQLRSAPILVMTVYLVD